jgi:hypothetical protein
LATASRSASAPIDADLATLCRQQASQHAQQGGLAATVGAMDEHRFAGVDVEIERAEDGVVVAREAQASHFKQGR